LINGDFKGPRKKVSPLHITRCLWLTAFTQSLWASQTAETLDKIEVQGSEKL